MSVKPFGAATRERPRGQLLAADLLDELILTVAPTFVGRGPALAHGEFDQRRLTLTELSRFGDDGVRLRYERAR